jgi:hypothetical protein
MKHAGGRTMCTCLYSHVHFIPLGGGYRVVPWPAISRGPVLCWGSQRTGGGCTILRQAAQNSCLCPRGAAPEREGSSAGDRQSSETKPAGSSSSSYAQKVPRRQALWNPRTGVRGPLVASRFFFPTYFFFVLLSPRLTKRKLVVAQMIEIYSTVFTGPCPQPDESSPHSYSLKM